MSQRAASRGGAVVRVVEQLREMLVSLELLPGQALRQEALAARLGVSRVPVREALSILHNEGVLEHVSNIGYAVKRLTASELEQAYLIRRALETELINALPKLSEEHLQSLTDINSSINDVGEAGDVLTMRRLNNEFHFSIFRAAGYDLVVRELHRVWALTDAYRSFYLYEPAARKRIVQEHAEMIEALRRHDPTELVHLMNQHRSMVPTQLARMIGGDGGRRPDLHRDD